MKNVKAKVKKIWILSSRAAFRVAGIFLVHHTWSHGLMIKISRDISAHNLQKSELLNITQAFS